MDQSTAQRGKEPLRTLTRYRNFDGPGTLSVGDNLEVLSRYAVS